MPQPSTFLIDSTNPNEQSWAWAQPIYWTSNRTYAFTVQDNISPNKAAFYKSIDGGATWTTPDIADALVCHAFADYYFDGVSSIVNILMVQANSGVQPLVLVNFDLNAETYSAPYGTVGAPSDNLVGLVRVAKTADNHLICFFGIVAPLANARARCAIYDIAGTTWGAPFDYATDLPGTGSTQVETIIPDPANNKVHVFYGNGTTFSYRTIASDGTLGAVQELPAGWNLHVGNLNQGRAFGAGYLKSGVLTVPVFTRDPGTAIFSLNVITGTPSSNPVFSISAPIETAASATEGWEPGQAVAYQVGSTQTVLYFAGDGLGNLYNLVRQATDTGSGWTASTLYNALNDPNAGKNARNNQWLNAISGAADPNGGPQFQVATWLTLPGQSFQNTATLSTQFSGSPSLAVDCNSLPAGNVGVAYSHAVLASGGTSPYTFAIIGGALPPGLSLGSATGIISGIPQQVGKFSFTIQVTDSAAATATIQCSININAGDTPSGGGGGGLNCRTVMCHPRLRSKCLGWGPLWITQDRGGYRLVYQSRTGLQTFPLLESGPLLQQIARCITRAECVPPVLNNPGALPLMRSGQIDATGQLARFPDWQTGVRYLYSAIQLALNQSKGKGRVM